jgi:hypothetical protein
MIPGTICSNLNKISENDFTKASKNENLKMAAEIM